MDSILVSGSIAYDRIMKFPGKFREHFHLEKMHALSVSFVVNTLDESFGGTAGNIAYNLALLKQNPQLLCAVGGDFQKYREHLQKVGVDLHTVQVEARIPSAVGHIITDDEDNQIAAFYAGAMARPYSEQIPDAQLAIVAAGNTMDMVELSQKIRSKGIPFLFDPGQQIVALSPQEILTAMQGAAVLFGNDYEIHMLMQKTGLTENELLKHVAVVVTTLGAKGSKVKSVDREFVVPSVPAVDVLDPTGAGDAYRAGFAAAWMKKLPIDICVQVASTVAVFAVESYGTQNHIFAMKDLKPRYEATYGSDFPL